MSQEKVNSEGKCLFCGKTFAKTGINRHLKTHLEQKSEEKDAKQGKSYLVKVETAPRWGGSGYFLSLWIDDTASFTNIDTFLRRIWLECCGHMSAFCYPVKKQSGRVNVQKMLEYMAKGKIRDLFKEDGDIPMSRKVNKVFRKGLKLEYRYDFGSTTALQLTVIEEFSIKADANTVLLSRNEPLKILCDSCKKEPATEMCIAHGWGKNSLFCPKCAKKHAKECADFEDYAKMPVVNSPRMGVCGYGGGAIDKERDGVYKG